MLFFLLYFQFVLATFTSHGNLTKMDIFIDAFHQALPELKWIRDNANQLNPIHGITQRHSQEAALRNTRSTSDYYSIDDEESNGDSWYNSFRLAECNEDANKACCIKNKINDSENPNSIANISVHNTFAKTPEVTTFTQNENVLRKKSYNLVNFLPIVI